jgi:PleD family two-component response regulator
MTQDDVIQSTWLDYVILDFIQENENFKNALKKAIPDMAADIESSSTNPTCTCRDRVRRYVTANNIAVGTFYYQFLVKHDLLTDLSNRFSFTAETMAKMRAEKAQNISGKVAKTTIKDWPGFVKNIKQTNLTFDHMSTSIVGDDVYVFFL